jgi:hypothetical protein
VEIQREPLRPESRAATGMTRRIVNGIAGNVRMRWIQYGTADLLAFLVFISTSSASVIVILY